MRLNFIAIVVVLVAAQLLGFLWYGVLFMEPWAAGFGIDMATVDQADPLPFVYSIVSTIVATIGLWWLVQRLGVDSAAGGARLGATVWLFFVVTTIVPHYAFGQVGTSAMIVDATNGLATMTLAGAILGMWQKKGHTT